MKKQSKPAKKADEKAAAKKASGKKRGALELRPENAAEVLESNTAYEGPLFKVDKERIREPNGQVVDRDVIRHSGSVVILAVDSGKKGDRKDPLIVMERQYRHAAGQYLWEIPAGRIEAGEERKAAAARELAEETGYAARRWTPLVRYYASPGFLSEWMQIFLAEELTRGEATPEADESLDVYPIRLSEVETLIDRGEILDGKTLIALGAWRRLLAVEKKSGKKKRAH